MNSPAPTRRSILYIGQMPAQGTGSPVIVWRHLRRLAAEGWSVSVIGESGQSSSACEKEGWSLCTLPHRRFWWPPFRYSFPDWLRRLRLRLLAREAARLLPAPPDAVLGYLAAHADFHAELAAACAATLKRPLTLLIHDDAAAFIGDARQHARVRARHARLLATARTNWFVSPALAAASPAPLDRQSVLPPLPEGWSGPVALPPAAGAPLRLYYAGHLWPEQVPLLARIARALAQAGARLVVMTRPNAALRSLLAAAPAEHQPAFPENLAALALLRDHAAAVIVSYAESVEAMPWIASSFPSKLVEFCHLGLPVAVIAPRATAVGDWAAHSGFGDFFLPDEVESRLPGWTRELADLTVWQTRAAASLALARGEFSPERIHRNFTDALLP